MFEMQIGPHLGGLPALRFGPGECREADNDNWGVCSPGQTPAEAMQMIRRLKAELRAELAADFRLRQCPTHRRHWEAVHAMERCARWHYYGER